MSTPRSVEFNENILLVVRHDISISVRHNYCHWSVILLRNGLGFDSRLNFAINVIFDELADMLFADLASGEWELQILDSVLNGKGGPLADLEVQVGSVQAERLCVDGGEVDLALMLLRQALQLFGQRGTFLRCLSENVGEWDAGLGLLHQFCDVYPA
jgi:hypothetical protein